MVAVIIIQQAPCHHSPLPPLKKGRMKERKHGDHPARYKKCSEQATQRGRSCEPFLCQDTKERAGSASPAASLALAPAPPSRHPPSAGLAASESGTSLRHLLTPEPRHGQSQQHPYSEAAERLLLERCTVDCGFLSTSGILLWLQGNPGAGEDRRTGEDDALL